MGGNTFLLLFSHYLSLSLALWLLASIRLIQFNKRNSSFSAIRLYCDFDTRSLSLSLILLILSRHFRHFQYHMFVYLGTLLLL